jgi:hypothetical protein
MVEMINPMRWPAPLISLIVIALFLSGCTPSTLESTPTPRPTQTPSPEPPEPLPDFRITDVGVEPKPIESAGRATIVRGTRHSFVFEVTNEGQGAGPGAVEVRISYGCQGPDIAGREAFVNARGPIGPGETRLTEPAFTVIIPADESPGTCDFEFMVDPLNIYQESDESPASNIREMTVEVH